MKIPWGPRACVSILVWVAGASVAVDGKASNASMGITDFIREAVWGGKEGGLYGHGHVEPRPGALTHRNQSQPQDEEEVVGKVEVPRVSFGLATIRAMAEERMEALEVPPATRTLGDDGKPARFCYVGACCGWGHRLMRQVEQIIQPIFFSFGLYALI